MKDGTQWIKYYGKWYEAERFVDNFNNIIYYLIAGHIILTSDIEEYGQIIK